MKRALLAALFVMSGQVAHAELNEVLITDLGFFPMISYVNVGDTVTFNNQAAAPRTVSSLEATGLDIVEWSSGELQHGESFSIIVTPATVMDFHTAVDLGDIGSFSFDEPPFEDDFEADDISEGDAVIAE
ncbi:hypothetical protein HCZ30_07960 [Marivivens donghaensis]|uniref:Plastocyanin n=1 Tax=Marivivens donghaensis TaxID=1699413 RepID=A0ABX0VWN3_9RHOB|nr:hypothetical protein [Marivivens donghaensis]NIY72371.1 hypothetical protein [Marivivens donghaensis]